MIDWNVRVIPGWVTLLPAIVTLGVSLLTKQVLLALPSGIWFGCWLIDTHLNPVSAFWATWDVYLVNALGDVDHAYVLIMTFFLSAMVSVASRSGGIKGLALIFTEYIKTSTSAMWICYIEGIAIFFDDYADTLICGNTVRPYMDYCYISREKFAFLVDATAAPIASIAPISSWIGFELGLIDDNYTQIYGEETGDTDSYTTFLETLPYRFYPWLMLIFMCITIAMKRDFGPMVKAERRCRKTGKVIRDGAHVDDAMLNGDPNMEPNEDVKNEGRYYWYLAGIPIILMVVVSFIGFIATGSWGCESAGKSKSLKNIFSETNSFRALVWGTVVSAFSAMGLAVWKKTLTFEESL
eukprot:UN06623